MRGVIGSWGFIDDPKPLRDSPIAGRPRRRSVSHIYLPHEPSRSPGLLTNSSGAAAGLPPRGALLP
jgi:hypothetical protein